MGRAGESARLLADVQCAALLAQLGGWDHVGPAALVAPVADSHDPSDTALEAISAGRAWMLTGGARHVIGADDASILLVVARSRPFAGRERGLRVYAVRPDAEGVACRTFTSMDGDPASRVDLDRVLVEDRDAVGPSRDATGAVTAALDVALLVAVAEMVGAARAALDASIAWVKTRQQFGAPLGDKQAVQHRAADMVMVCTGVEALLEDALVRLEAGADVSVEATVAKLVASERLPDVTASAHQLHGGEGYYADRPLHQWHRRVIALAYQLGDASVQRRRLARVLQGR
jgi:alkylation response protein AidB-like acyl-CoA dehydrogenase